MARPRTAAQKDAAKEKRLQKEYGITLAERDARAIEQNHKCKICGGALDAYGYPQVDHYHFYIEEFRHTPGLLHGFKWYAQAYNEKGQVICARDAKTRAAARADVKRAMLPWSVRGLLCFKCNRGLGYIERFFDAAKHPEHLLPVIDYFNARLKTVDKY